MRMFHHDGVLQWQIKRSSELQTAKNQNKKSKKSEAKRQRSINSLQKPMNSAESFLFDKCSSISPDLRDRRVQARHGLCAPVECSKQFICFVWCFGCFFQIGWFERICSKMICSKMRNLCMADWGDGQLSEHLVKKPVAYPESIWARISQMCYD